MEVPEIPNLIPPQPEQQTLPGMPPPTVPVKIRYRAAGKEVLRNGEHYGDMIDENAANCVVAAMNAEVEQAEWAEIVGRAR
jgi:hypothetical protein